MNDITQKLRLIFGVEGEEKANTQVKSLDKSIMGLAKNIGLAAIAYKTFTTALDIGKKSLQSYNESIIALRQTEATLRSTGQSANWTTKELANMASELQHISKFGDEEILKGATQSLLRFDGIGKELFPRVQALTVDMAEGMGSLEGAAKTLGISLADPLLGMTRLRRAGVMFNETQQETIKGLVETGNKSEAQKYLLDALEEKYKGLALASATTTQQLKNAWDDYLETVGGSLSFFEGVKSAFTQYLILMAKESDTFTEGEINNSSAVQMAWGDATTGLIVSGKGLTTFIWDFVKISGGAINLVANLVAQGVFAIDFELKKLINKYFQTIKKIIDTISAFPPAVMSILGGDELKNAFGSIADIWSKSADTKKVNPYLEKLKSDSKEISTIIADSVKDLGNIPKSVEQTYSTITWEVRKRINELNELSKKGIDTSALQKMLEDYEKGLGDTGDNLKQILITNEEAMRDYYEIISKYSQDWIDSQLKQYRIEIDAKYSTVLTKEQIDNMYYAKERELQKEAYDYFQNIEKDKADKMKEMYEVELAETQKFWEAYQKYIETSREIELQVTTDRNRYIDLRIQKIQEEYDEYQKQGINSVLLDKWRADQIKKIYSEIPDNIKNLSDIVQENMSNISSSITNILGNTIYDFISRTKSMKDAWNNAWEAMAEITMRIISQIIAQMIELFFMQKLVGLATGGIGGAGTIPSIAPGAFEIPPAPIASTGRNNLSTININNQQNELMMSITQVKSLDKSIVNLAKGIGLAALAYKAFTTALDIGKKSLQNYNEQIIAMRQIETTLRSTGQAINWTTQELANMASELQNVSKFGDDEILKGATQSLLRFDGISKEIFPRVQALTVDMAESMGSLDNAAKTLGISLADPLLGLTRLRRVGVMFNETQEATIKGFVESGKKIEAQKYILSALEDKYKGLALVSVTASEQLKIASTAPGALEIPAVPIASAGRNNLNNINTNNQLNELMMSIDGLKREIASNREQNFNLYLDGLPLRNAIKRVEKNLNIMGN